jgi:polysaccharide biosynthesis transport protein
VDVVLSNNRPSLLSRILGYEDTRIDLSSPFLQKPGNNLDSNEYAHYKVDADYYSTSSLKELIEKNTVSSGYKPEYIIVEIPPILYYSFSPQMIASADLAILVCRANRVWSAADQGALATLKKTATHEPVALIDGVELLVIESVLGDLPKKRSRARRILKKIVRFQFLTRNQI